MSATPAPKTSSTPKAGQVGDELLYEVRGNVGLVTFNRPQARNALTFNMYDKLAEICAGIKPGGAIRALVLTGAGGKAFAAGTDISQFRAFETPEQGLKYEADASARSAVIAACPVPLIAAISGACTGGGAGIAANCDIRLGTHDMRFGFPIARTLGNMLSASTLAGLVAHFGEIQSQAPALYVRADGRRGSVGVRLRQRVARRPCGRSGARAWNSPGRSPAMRR